MAANARHHASHRAGVGPGIGRAKRELEDEGKTARYSVPDFIATRCTPAHRLER